MQEHTFVYSALSGSVTHSLKCKRDYAVGVFAMSTIVDRIAIKGPQVFSGKSTTRWCKIILQGGREFYVDEWKEFLDGFKQAAKLLEIEWKELIETIEVNGIDRYYCDKGMTDVFFS